MVYVRRTTTVRKRYYRRPRYSRRRRYKRRLRKTGKRSAYISPKTAEKFKNLESLWIQNFDTGNTADDLSKYGTAVNILASYLNIMHKMNRWIIRYRRRKNWIFLIFNSTYNIKNGASEISWPNELLPRNYIEIRKLSALLSNPPISGEGTKPWQQSVDPYFTTPKLLAAFLYKGLNYNQLETCLNALEGINNNTGKNKLYITAALGNAARSYILHSIRRYAITPLVIASNI